MGEGDDAARPDGPARLVYAGDGAAMRLIEFVDERGRRTRYAYDDARGLVAARGPDGPTAEYAVPPGAVLARARHPETGAWVHVCLPGPPPAGPAGPAWPTRWPGATAEGATPARPAAGAPPAAGRAIDPAGRPGAADVPGPPAPAVAYTYDRDGRLIDVRAAGPAPGPAAGP